MGLGRFTLTLFTLAVLLLISALAHAHPDEPSDARQKTAYFGPLGLTAISLARLNVLAQDHVRIGGAA